MITAVATRSFLVRQEMKEGKKQDITAKRGEKIKLSEEEAIKFWGGLDISEADKKTLLRLAKKEGYKRVI